VLLRAGFSFAQQAKKVGGRTIVRMIQLEHAGPEQLASVLRLFLSPEGSIVPIDSFFSSSCLSCQCSTLGDPSLQFNQF
jgi:hypothetical protein